MYLTTDQPVACRSAHFMPSFAVETLLEQGSSELNEDVLLEAEGLFGVFDGATSLDTRRFDDGLTGGLLAAQTAARVFQQERASLSRLAEKANNNIRKALQQRQVSIDERHRLWSTSMAVVRMGANRLEYCQTGDALIVLLYNDGTYRVVTPDLDIDRETLQLWQDCRITPSAPIHELLAEQIQCVRLQMNISYGVLNGEAAALEFLRHGYEELDNVSDILLFTDGLFLPRENPLEDSDWRSFVNLYRQGGLQAVRDHVRCLQCQDPTLKKYPRFKLHDDIAAVAIKLHLPN
ncbi:protein phosphatase 2C domain-containing protein [Desulfocastanea catecholica]